MAGQGVACVSQDTCGKLGHVADTTQEWIFS